MDRGGGLGGGRGVGLARAQGTGCPQPSVGSPHSERVTKNVITHSAYSTSDKPPQALLFPGEMNLHALAASTNEKAAPWGEATHSLRVFARAIARLTVSRKWETLNGLRIYAKASKRTTSRSVSAEP